MKTHLIHHTALAAFLALSAAYAGAQPQSSSTLQPVTPRLEASALERVSGQPVRGSNDEPISTVADFLIEPRTGELRFAVVPSGSNTFRIVPMAAIETSGNAAQGLKLKVDREQWDKVGTLTDEWLQDRVSMDTNHRQRLQQQFGVDQPLPDDGTTVMLVRASSLKGKPIQTENGNETLGTVSDVSVDLQAGYAWLLLNARGGFPGAGQTYLFPFDRLQMAEGANGALTTNLTRNDFARSQPGLR